MNLAVEIVILATGKVDLPRHRCRYCGRFLFAGFLYGEIMCKCGVTSVFQAAKKVVAEKIRQEYISP